jgi:hypothetical protein
VVAKPVKQSDLHSLLPQELGVFWMHHDEPEDDNSDGYSASRTNTYEISMIVALVKHLSQQGVYKSADIAVKTWFEHTVVFENRIVDLSNMWRWLSRWKAARVCRNRRHDTLATVVLALSSFW